MTITQVGHRDFHFWDKKSPMLTEGGGMRFSSILVLVD